MRSRTAKTSIVLCNRKLRALSSLYQHKRHSQLVRPLSSFISTLLTNCRFSASCSVQQSSSKTTHLESQPLRFSGIAQSVISRCPDLFLYKETDKGKEFASVGSYRDLLLEISDIVPELTRKFRRVSELRPQDVLEILVGFEFECRNVGFEARKVESLWELFKWAGGQHEGFKHIHRSWEVMARILVQVGLFREVELLAFEMDKDGVMLGCHEIFSDLIEGYVGVDDLNRAISMYDRMRRRGLAPSLSCFCFLLGSLVRMRKTQVAYRVCMDMVDVGIGSSETVKMVLDGVIKLLCDDGNVQDARNLVKKVMTFGFDVNSLDVNGIVYGYCENRDFDDVLSFFREIKCAPNILAGNRIMYSFCSYFGSGSAQFLMEELEDLGFVPDEITLGILIGWCCREGKLRSSFAYLEEIFSRGLKPHINSFNALACGLFLNGMCKHAWNIFDEMVEKGSKPNLSTFQIFLAGYCKARQFDEVKRTVSEMKNHGLVQNISLEDQLSRAFSVLGFDPLTVRLKRDNEGDLSNSCFFDDLGNGLYLDTNLNEYERRVTVILEDSLVPDYNSLVMKECNGGNLKVALTLAEEMAHWGQKLSLPVFSVLLKGLCSFPYPLKVYEDVLEKNLKLLYLLDQGTLNLLVQVYCKRGWTNKGKIVLDGMFRRRLKIENETFTAMIIGLCKTGNLRNFHSWWEIAEKERWLPRLENCRALLQCLCKREMLEEALELLGKMVACPHLRLDICYLFLEKLSLTKSTRLVHILLDELIQQGYVIDRVAYDHVIRGMCNTRKFSEALKILEKLLAKNLTLSFDVAISLIPQLCRANRHDKAIALKEISLRENPFFMHPISNALIKGFCMTGKVGEATSILQEMSLNGILPDAETYDILVQGFCKVNNLIKAKELLAVMIRNCIELSIPAYRNLVLTMCREGNVPLALKLKELMLGQGDSRDLIIYNILIFQLLSNGNRPFLSEVLDDLQKKKLQLDEVSYNFLVYGFSKRRDVSSAYDYLSTMISKEHRPSNRSLRAAITAMCNSKELEKALALSREMELRGWLHDSTVQNAIVEGLLCRDEFEEAEDFLERLVEKQLIPDNINYDNLIKRFCSFGRTKKAVDLLNVMLKKGIVPNSTSYESIVTSCCASNSLNYAMNFHTEMLDRNLRPSFGTWNILVCHFCQDGQTAEAERILVSMLSIGETPTKDMFSAVIDRYHLENNSKKASELVEMMQRSGFEPDFEMHWSVISNLKDSFREANNGNGKGFLSRLLSDSGFFGRNNSKTK